MLNIGITGGIGSGKTTVCKIFQTLEIPVYYADIEAKNMLQKNREVKNAVKKLLGIEAYYRNGRPNKTYIAQKIFKDKKLLERMNAIIHPAVKLDGDKWFENQKKTIPKPPFALKEAALLVENGSFKLFDKIIVVTCPENIRIKRVMSRDNVTEAIILQRLANQLPESEKIAVADYVIINDGKTALIPQVYAVFKEILGVKK